MVAFPPGRSGWAKSLHRRDLVRPCIYDDKLSIFVLVMNDIEQIEQLLNQNKQLTVVQKENLRDQLVNLINLLLLHDFNGLVQVLYRVDVSEQKLKKLLQKNQTTDAAVIITDLLIERQEEKIKMKNSFKTGNDISDDDRW
jgi:hypothetical protein